MRRRGGRFWMVCVLISWPRVFNCSDTAASIALKVSPMLTQQWRMPRCLMSFMLSSMSGCTLLGMVTPITRSLPKASAHKAATTLLSLPPEMPMTALQPGPFASNQSLIHWTTWSFTFFALNVGMLCNRKLVYDEIFQHRAGFFQL